MAFRLAHPRDSNRRTWWPVLIALGVLATAAPWTGAAGAPTHHERASSPGFVPRGAVGPGLASAPRPAGSTNLTLGTVYGSTELPPANATSAPCQSAGSSFFVQATCYPQTQNPSLVTLASGHLGVAESMYTTVGPLCNATANSTNLTSWTVTNIAWSESLANASVWGSPVLLGTPSCRWPAASEPTFAAGSGGSVYGAFVLSNQTVNATPLSGIQPLFPPDWSRPAGDRLAFVSSTNNGTNWSAVGVIPNVTSAVRPQMAVFGSSIYVVYIDTNNSTATYPGGFGLGSFHALSVDLVASKDGGVHWAVPVVLPGWNASMANWSTAPSIAVGPGGTIAVAYATNRTCLDMCSGGFFTFPVYGEQIVVARSTTNGSSWTRPVVAGNWTGESYTFSDYADSYNSSYAYPWMATPETAVAFGPSNSLYVVYAGTFAKTSLAGYAYLNWQYTGVFAAYSSNGGTTWVNTSIASDTSLGNDDNFYSPGIALSGSIAYVAYVWLNGTFCFSSSGCAGFDGTASSWVASATNGSTWSSTFAGIASYGSSPYIASDFQGWQSSVTISPGGLPVAATVLPGAYSVSFGAGGPPFVLTEDFWTNVSIAYQYAGPTTNVTFVEHNLTAGTTWGISFDARTITSNQSSIVLANVPEHLAFPIAVLPEAPTGYRMEYVTGLSIRSPAEFTGPSTVDVNFTAEYGLQLWIEPTLTSFSGANPEISMFFRGTFYFIETFFGNVYSGPSFPWYFPANVTLSFQLDSSPPFSYWNGSGVGSVTGAAGGLNLTLGSAVNETGWAGTYGVYTEGFRATGLPATSRYSFTFDGTGYGGPAPNWTYVPDVATGGYTVSDIRANSSTPGWEYFGWVAGGSNTVVVPAQPSVTFDFALADLAAAS
ncbi:MAG: hypothetical protein L3K05_07060, partial [Thermoplasmata archaeon]|nr:hypothetical protein [Thermoplasmata archaeon]